MQQAVKTLTPVDSKQDEENNLRSAEDKLKDRTNYFETALAFTQQLTDNLHGAQLAEEVLRKEVEDLETQVDRMRREVIKDGKNGGRGRTQLGGIREPLHRGPTTTLWDTCQQEETWKRRRGRRGSNACRLTGRRLRDGAYENHRTRVPHTTQK